MPSPYETAMSVSHRLTVTDVDRLRTLRAEALATDPWAFGSAPGEDRFESAEPARAALDDPDQAIFAVEGPDPTGVLVAMAGVRRSTRTKHAHLASIRGVFVQPDARRRGHGRAVLEACIAWARDRPGVDRIALSVSERTPAARALYASRGFETWGVEPDCTRIDGDGAAEHHMHLVL